MKKILALLFLIVLAVTLISCGASQSQENPSTNERFGIKHVLMGARVIVDNDTGCKYIFVKMANTGGMSPLYNKNGEIDCGE